MFRSEPRNGDPGLPWRRPREPAFRDAGALPGRRFPRALKYGYLNVGVVEEGPPALLGRTVFSLYPHQTHYVVPASAVTPVPDAVPASRAVLAGTVETAVNALWDAAPLVGDRIAVIGAGMVGCGVAAILARYPAVRVQLVDADPARAATAKALGVDFALPQDALGDCDLVVHASATEEGLARSLELLAPEGTVIELSWYGDRQVSLPLGRPSTPAGWSSAAVRWARSPRPAAPAVPSPTGSRSPWTCSPTRLRRADHRRVRLRGAAGGAAPARLRRPAGAVPPHPLRVGGRLTAPRNRPEFHPRRPRH